MATFNFPILPFGIMSCGVRDNSNELMGTFGKNYTDKWYAYQSPDDAPNYIFSVTIPKEPIYQLYIDIRTWGMNDSPVYLTTYFHFGSNTQDAIGHIASSDAMMVRGIPLKFEDILKTIEAGQTNITSFGYVENIHTSNLLTVPIEYTFDSKTKRLAKIVCTYPVEFYEQFKEHLREALIPMVLYPTLDQNN